MAARATPKTLARKRSKGYAPRDDEDEDDDVIFVKEIGAHSRYIFCPCPAAVAVKRKLLPASEAPPPAKVSPPIKFPVVPDIDPRLRISSSKVQAFLGAA